MKKKLLALLLSLTMCLGMSMTANAMPTLTSPGSRPLGGLENAKGMEIGQENQNGSISYKSHYTELELNLIKSLFDPEYYAEQYPDVVLVLGNNKDTLWNHYVRYGLAEGRQINRNFNVLAYSAAYPDLQEAFGDDILAYYVHYMVYGKNEHRQLTTLEKATSAGITVTGMNGQIIAKPDPVVQKNSNNTGTDLSSAAQGTMNTNNNTSSASGSGDKKPEETVCQHEYEVTKIVIEDGYHIITKKCKKCNNVVEGTPEDHNYDTIKECGNDRHSRVCGACGAVDSSSLANHEFNSVPYDETHHRDTCDTCGYYIEAAHTYQNGKCTACGYEHKEHNWNSENGKCSICEKVCEHSRYIGNSKTTINTDTTHRIDRVCSHCGYVTIGEEEVHSFGSSIHIEGTLTHKRTCACGAEKIENCASEPGWNPDGDTYHFRRCQECTGETAREKHNFSNGYCTSCGYSCREHQWNDGVCTVCGYECTHNENDFVSAEPTNSLEHKATYRCLTCGKEWTEEERCSGIRIESIDDTSHGEKCTKCGRVINQSNHIFSYSTKDDANHIKKCQMCDYSVDEAHITDGDIESISSTQHGKKCDKCQDFFEVGQHTFGENGKCTVCGADCEHTNTEDIIELIDDNAESHKVIQKCKDCGHVESAVTEPHRFGECTPYRANDYDLSAAHTKVCSDCQYVVLESCTEYREPNGLAYHDGSTHEVPCGVCWGIMNYEKHNFGPYNDMSNCKDCGARKEDCDGSSDRDDNVIIPS